MLASNALHYHRSCLALRAAYQSLQRLFLGLFGTSKFSVESLVDIRFWCHMYVTLEGVRHRPAIIHIYIFIMHLMMFIFFQSKGEDKWFNPLT